VSRAERLLAPAVAAFALAWGWPALTGGYEGPYDEGNTLVAATRVLAGDVPYRDFWLLHPPGTAWLLAGAFRVFGPTLAVERAVKLAVVAVAAVLVFLLARLVARPRGAAAAALLFVVLPTQTLSLRTRDTGLVLVLAALLAASSPSAHPRRRALLAGLLAGFTVFFKQDFVLAAAAGGATALLLDAAARKRLSRNAGKEGRASLFLEGLLPFAAGLAAGPAALAATLAAHGTLGEFFEQAIRFPATSFARFRSIPLSLRFEQLAGGMGPGIPLKGALAAGAVPILFLAALLVALAAAARAASALRRSTGGADDAGGTGGANATDALPAALASSVACLFLLAAPVQRADLEHLNPAMGLALIALAAVTAPRGSAPAPRIPLILRISPGLLFFLFSIPPILDRARALKARVFAPASAGATGLAAAPRWIGLPEDVAAAARFVASASAPGERLFVGNARHDRLAYGATLVYVLAGRSGATRYDNLHPGVATTRAVQEEIVRALQTEQVRWVVLWDGPPPTEPNESSRSSGVHVLDDWLAAHGRETARFGSFRVLAIGPGPAPPTPAR
jgi:hypothetical protein